MRSFPGKIERRSAKMPTFCRSRSHGLRCSKRCARFYTKYRLSPPATLGRAAVSEDWNTPARGGLASAKRWVLLVEEAVMQGIESAKRFLSIIALAGAVLVQARPATGQDSGQPEKMDTEKVS